MKDCFLLKRTFLKYFTLNNVFSMKTLVICKILHFEFKRPVVRSFKTIEEFRTSAVEKFEAISKNLSVFKHLRHKYN